MFAPLIEPGEMDERSRWKLVARLAERWFSVTLEGCGYPAHAIEEAERRLGVTLPTALRDWYFTSAALREVWCLQDHLLPPHRLSISDDMLVFLIENQACATWGVPVHALADDDPPVTLLVDGDRHEREGASVSEFALQFLISNIRWSRGVKYSANGQATDEAIRIAEDRFPALPLPAWHWPVYPSRTLASPNVAVQLDGDTWMWIAALDSASFAEVTKQLEAAGVDWEFKSNTDVQEVVNQG